MGEKTTTRTAQPFSWTQGKVPSIPRVVVANGEGGWGMEKGWLLLHSGEDWRIQRWQHTRMVFCHFFTLDSSPGSAEVRKARVSRGHATHSPHFPPSPSSFSNWQPFSPLLLPPSLLKGVTKNTLLPFLSIQFVSYSTPVHVSTCSFFSFDFTRKCRRKKWSWERTNEWAELE